MKSSNQLAQGSLEESSIRHDWKHEEVLEIHDKPFNDLLFIAQTVHRKYFNPNRIQLSQLLSIKTGGCAEDCGYCSQSAHHKTSIEPSKLMDVAQVLDEARKAKESGATRYCMGAAWREPKARDMPNIISMIKGVKELGLETCMTLGMLSQEQVEQLHLAGLDYYNHNIDTSEHFYPEIVQTRKFSDRLNTLERVRNTGIKVCCGGILGMGEAKNDRVDMLATLANLSEHPESIPINMLISVPGTPLESKDKIDPIEFVRVIATARIIMPKSFVRLSAGRKDMSDEMQALCFFAGANSIFYGDTLLTADNPKQNRDAELLNKLGIRPFKLPRSQSEVARDEACKIGTSAR
ncbi:MAG: biotin synthase BioB [Hyphomicrobium sp.]